MAQRRRGTRTAPPTPSAQPAPPATPAQAKPSATPAPAQSNPPVATQKTDAPQPAREAAKSTKGTWRLKVATAQPRLISLKADHARVEEIAAELARKLDVPVLLSPVMEKAQVTLEFTTTPLEGALRMIAPQPYIDYELSGNTGGPGKIVAIYLYALNEPPPSDTQVVRGDSEAILIEGNTEDGLDGSAERDKQEKSLTVKVDRNQVTVRARKQPLTAVLFEIANKVDIPFEMKYDSSELVDVDLSNASMEQVVRSLSPNIRLYQRTDLQTYETRPLRIVLAPPTSTQQTTRM
ncbi:MAG TPA: hypothetical protein VF525_09785 [Pyrinomonadaceae bacterium]